MNTLNLFAVAATKNVFADLSRRKLIRMLVPTASVAASRAAGGAVATIYSSAPAFGTHKLICVKPNSPQIKLNSHAANEEFILINPEAKRFRPLYMIIGLHKHEVLEQKIARGTLTCKDLLAIRLRFNDPQVSIFTMLKGTPHCEITTHDRRPAPIFFVTEPSRLPMRMVKRRGYRFLVKDAER
jgi:hypothetical protein